MLTCFHGPSVDGRIGIATVPTRVGIQLADCFGVRQGLLGVSGLGGQRISLQAKHECRQRSVSRAAEIAASVLYP